MCGVAAVTISRRRVLRVLVLVLSVVVAGCATGPSSGAGDGTPAAAPKTSTPASSPTTAAPQPADQCGAPTTQAEAFWLSGQDGAWWQGAVVGTGPDTAVFVHESGTQGLCGFWPYADWLASAEGVRSVLFNQCTYGASQCAAIDEAEEWIAATEAAVAWARDHDARRVTIVGASAGGVVALHAATSITPRVDAVVNLSGELSWSDLNSVAAAERLDIATLFAIAPGDPYVTIDEMQSVIKLPRPPPNSWSCCPTERATAGKCSPTPAVPAGHRWRRLSPAGYVVGSSGMSQRPHLTPDSGAPRRLL